MDYREKLYKLMESLKMNSMDESIKDVEDFINACGEYVNAVMKMETAMISSQFYLESKENREYINSLDSDRRVTHNCLISYLNGVNRYCNEAGVAPIYEGDGHRVDIGDFALRLVNELFQARKL